MAEKTRANVNKKLAEEIVQKAKESIGRDGDTMAHRAVKRLAREREVTREQLHRSSKN